MTKSPAPPIQMPEAPPDPLKEAIRSVSLIPEGQSPRPRDRAAFETISQRIREGGGKSPTPAPTRKITEPARD